MALGVCKTATATIADAASLSGAVYIGGRLLRLIIPGVIASAAITFQVSDDGTNFYNLYDDDTGGTEVSLAASTGQRAYRLNGNYWSGIAWLKVRSGTSGTPVVQSGGDDILLVSAGEY